MLPERHRERSYILVLAGPRLRGVVGRNPVDPRLVSVRTRSCAQQFSQIGRRQVTPGLSNLELQERVILFEPEIRGLAWASLFLESPQVFLKLACARGQTPHNSSQPGLRLESPL